MPNRRRYELRWLDDEGHPDSIQFEMSDEQAHAFIASRIATDV